MRTRSVLAVAAMLCAGASCDVRTACGAAGADTLELLPYPQEVELTGGSFVLGPPDLKSDRAPAESAP
jgi:hypothetical protein